MILLVLLALLLAVLPRTRSFAAAGTGGIGGFGAVSGDGRMVRRDGSNALRPGRCRAPMPAVPPFGFLSSRKPAGGPTDSTGPP